MKEATEKCVQYLRSQRAPRPPSSTHGRRLEPLPEPAAWLICAVVVEGLNQGEPDSERAPVWKEEEPFQLPRCSNPVLSSSVERNWPQNGYK